jgi:uncharacterized protein YigE (DUF2233 family)
MLRPMIARIALAGLLGLLAIVHSREADAVDCQKVAQANAAYVVCRINVTHERLRLYYADARGRRLESFEALRENLRGAGLTLAFAMNAGMFHPDFKPVGLLVIDGVAIAPITRRQGTGNFFLQPNGVFVLDAQGARVMATGDYRNLTPELATQSGPMLVHHGQIPDIPAFHADSRSRKIRNGVCAQSPEVAAFVISESPVTLHEFATFFRRWLGCSEALYLDGTISSLYSPQLKRADSHSSLGPMFAVAQ